MAKRQPRVGGLGEAKGRLRVWVVGQAEARGRGLEGMPRVDFG